MVAASWPNDVVAALRDALERRGTSWSHRGEVARALDVLADPASRLAALGPGLADVRIAFSLDDDDAALLAVALLAEAHPAGHLACGLLAGDEGAARPTVALALELAGLPATSARARDRLGPLGLLRRTGLVELDGADVLLSRRLVLPDRVTARLLGSHAAPARLVPLLVEPVPAEVPGLAEVAAALRAGEGLVWVHSPWGTAGAALAVGACRELGVTCLVVDLERLAVDAAGRRDPVEVTAAVRAASLEAGLDGSVLVLVGAHLAGHDVRIFDGCVVPVVAVGRTAWDPRWHATLPPAVLAGRLPVEQRATAWESAVGPEALDREVLALRMTPEEIVAVGRRARADARAAGRAVDVVDVRRSARRLGGAGGSRVRTGTSPATLDDLVLPEHTRREVVRLVGWARDRDEVLALGDLHGKGGKGSGICALFSGSPGTGKTLAAHVVADSLGMDLFQVDLSTVVDKYVGQTEKNLERVFEQAESLNAVLFFDEADSLFGSRSAVNDSRDRYANQEVAYLLQRMEASEGITILATNLRGNLDPAFARRLHFMIHFPDPDVPTRERLWRHHLAQLPSTDPADPVDVEMLARDLEIAGGDVRNIVLAATYDAVAEQVDLGMRHVRGAALREMSKLGRRVSGSSWSGA